MVGLTLISPGLVELGLAPDHIDLVLLHQIPDAAVQPRRDAARAGDDGGNVGGDRAFELQAVILGVFGEMQDFRRAQQRLGRDAAPVEADAAQMLALDDGGLQPQLRGADRRHIAAGAGADDDDVIGVCHGSASVVRSIEQ